MKVISASEIGEFYFCQLSWRLRKSGVQAQKVKELNRKLKSETRPKEIIRIKKQIIISKKTSANLVKGVKRHEKMGQTISVVQKKEVQINYLKYIVYGLLALLALLFLLSL